MKQQVTHKIIEISIAYRQLKPIYHGGGIIFRSLSKDFTFPQGCKLLVEIEE